MKQILLLTTFIPLLLLAKSTATFKIGGQLEQFFYFKSEHLTISQSCGSQLKKLNCLAYTQGVKASRKNIATHLFRGGVNPGVVICRQQFKGKIVTGTNQYGANSFCRFKDGSLIDSGSLTYYSLRKR